MSTPIVLDMSKKEYACPVDDCPCRGKSFPFTKGVNKGKPSCAKLLEHVEKEHGTYVLINTPTEKKTHGTKRSRSEEGPVVEFGLPPAYHPTAFRVFKSFVDFQRFCEEELSAHPIGTKDDIYYWLQFPSDFYNRTDISWESKRAAKKMFHTFRETFCRFYCDLSEDVYKKLEGAARATFFTVFCYSSFKTAYVDENFKLLRMHEIEIRDRTTSLQDRTEEKYGSSTRVKCTNGGCSNYGNTKYDGICFSCAQKVVKQ